MKEETKKKIKKALIIGTSVAATAGIAVLAYKKVPQVKTAVNFIVEKIKGTKSTNNSIVKNNTTFIRPPKKRYHLK